VLAPGQYATDKLLVIESVEICAIKDPVPTEGPCIFTGKTAAALTRLGRDDLYISESTFHYDGGRGCC
jgi:hypothetical protein